MGRRERPPQGAKSFETGAGPLAKLLPADTPWVQLRRSKKVARKTKDVLDESYPKIPRVGIQGEEGQRKKFRGTCLVRRYLLPKRAPRHLDIHFYA